MLNIEGLYIYADFSGLPILHQLTSLVPCVSILDIAVFLNFLTAWTIIKLIADLNCNQFPLGSCGLEILSLRQRQDVCF